MDSIPIIVEYFEKVIVKNKKKLMKTLEENACFMHCAQYKSKIRKIVSKIWKFSIESN